MSDEDLLGKFETTVDGMQKMLQWSSAPFDLEKHDKAYFNLSVSSLRTIANAGEAVGAYCTYNEPYVENIELHEDIDEDAGMESIVRVPQVKEFLHFVGGDTIVFEFFGDSEEGRARKLAIDGELRAEIYLPNSKTNYNSMQLGIVNLYDEDNNWVSPGDSRPLDTKFTTDCSEFQRIIDIVEFDDFALSNYPVVIEDGEFVLDASDKNERDTVAGTLQATDVEGPDVSNYYSRGFDNLFSNVSGEIDVQLADDAPISIVRESNDEAMTLRYSILPIA